MTKEEFDKLEGMLVEDWAGYSFEELKYKRAVALARKEIQKERTLNRAQHIVASGISISNVGGSLAKNLFGTVSIVDYVVIGFKLARKISKFLKEWRK